VDFDFELPTDRIAQAPLPRRDDARLYVLDRQNGAVQHRNVRDLPSLLPPGALVVVNDTRVIKARLAATKPTGGAVELLLVEPLDPGDDHAQHWRCIGGASKPIRPGPLRLTGDGAPACEVLAVDGKYVDVRIAGDAFAYAEAHGEVPLPPYIKRPAPQPDDRERYQTVFARAPGAVAAPTAGLHFTPVLMQALADAGVKTARVTLHVGAGTFQPVRAADTEQHTMHAEWGEVSQATADAIKAAKRVVSVGTTALRLLESVARSGPLKDRRVRAWQGETDIFITPGFDFRVVDLLLTNFHLPRSTLFMLVAAFAGLERMKQAYAHAVDRRYRFYSYGDCCLLRR
jgi:S-adenosylmethionine:tRNA ribosyltransferase-isomerase